MKFLYIFLITDIFFYKTYLFIRISFLIFFLFFFVFKKKFFTKSRFNLFLETLTQLLLNTVLTFHYIIFFNVIFLYHHLSFIVVFFLSSSSFIVNFLLSSSSFIVIFFHYHLLLSSSS